MFQINQWVTWELVQVPGEKKPRKIPRRDGHNINPHDPQNWISYEEAARIGAPGFVFTEGDPFFFVDLDNAVDSSGAWSQLACDICAMFPGAYMESSQSGQGLHIIARGKIPSGVGCKVAALGIELYDHKRFAAITRYGEIGSAQCDHQNALDQLCATYMLMSTAGTPSEWTTTAHSEWHGIDNDDDLIARMMQAAPSANAAWGTAASLPDLWEGSPDQLKQFYPNPDCGLDASSADAALLSHLAFWTGSNCERIDRLFRRSGLVRDKWTNREDYRTRSILKATGNCKKFHTLTVGNSGNEILDDSDSQLSNGTTKSTYQYMSADGQLDHFKGCAYILDTHRIFLPKGMRVKPEQFKVAYGGYDFMITSNGDKTTKCAWEAFSTSRAATFPKVDTTAFRPELPSAHIFKEAGYIKLNTYVPAIIRKKHGNPSRFLELVHKILPNERDFEIVLAYMAACVQYVGHKFQWCVLLQGVEGNGKTLMGKVLSYAVGEIYTHEPQPEDISNKFNSWIENKLLICINEVYTADRRELIDTLKILITESRSQIQPKNCDQYMGDNRANFFMCTNHKDAIRKTKNDRRYAIFYTAQQSYADFARDDMDGEYFPELWDWLRKDGFAIVAEYLSTYAIPDHLNPAKKCHRAPETSSVVEAIMESRSAVEQEIMNTIGEHNPGFRNGWVSSIALDKLLKTTNKSYISRNKRTEILKKLGYSRMGRAGCNVTAEGGRPVLYAADFVGVPDCIQSAYMLAQGYVISEKLT